MTSCRRTLELSILSSLHFRECCSLHICKKVLIWRTLAATAMVSMLLFFSAGGFLSKRRALRHPATDQIIHDCREAGLPPKAILRLQHYHRLNALGKKRYGRWSFCKSQYEQHCYRKHSTWEFFPSPSFLARLREYENYHERCTHGVNLTELAMDDGVVPPSGCKYLVWKSLDGMGNLMVSLVSAFLYSLLTNRAMLIATDSNVQNIFCEPFPASSWVLPDDFPEEKLRLHMSKRVGTYVAEIKNVSKDSCNLLPASREEKIKLFAYKAPKRIRAYIICCDFKDHQFFCPTAQKLISNIPWLFFHSHEYSAPGFYFIPEYRTVLNQWFPDRAIFMHAARYLLNPQDSVWNRITHLYKSYLAGADRLLGIQVRAWNAEYHPIVNKHVLKCGMDTGLLPRPIKLQGGDEAELGGAGTTHHHHAAEKVAVLVTSLRPEYHENLAEFYHRNSDLNGTLLSVVSPSQEWEQKTGNSGHDEKAVIEIWLLSFMDDLIITPVSTFGSSASGLAGMVPVLFHHYAAHHTVPEPAACGKSNLAGPCFIKHPRNLPCELDPPSSSIFDAGHTVPEVQSCWLNQGVGTYQP